MNSFQKRIPNERATRRSERGPARHPAFLAAMAEAGGCEREPKDAPRRRNENQNENENARAKEHDDAEDGAEVGEPRAAESRRASAAPRGSSQQQRKRSVGRDDDVGVSTRTRDAYVSYAYVPSPRVSLDADEGAFSDSSAPMTASPKPATRKPFSFEDIPPSARDAESGIRFEDTLETPFDFGNPSGFPKSGNGKRRETGTSGSRAETVTRDRSAIERLSPSGASAASVSPPPREDTRYLVATPRAFPRAGVWETRRRAAERERAEAARLFKARREEAGREALRRFFADAKPKPARNGAPSRLVSRGGGSRGRRAGGEAGRGRGRRLLCSRTRRRRRGERRRLRRRGRLRRRWRRLARVTAATPRSAQPPPPRRRRRLRCSRRRAPPPPPRSPPGRTAATRRKTPSVFSTTRRALRADAEETDRRRRLNRERRRGSSRRDARRCVASRRGAR